MRRNLWQVHNLTRTNQTSDGSRLKVDASCWNVYCRWKCWLLLWYGMLIDCGSRSGLKFLKGVELRWTVVAWTPGYCARRLLFPAVSRRAVSSGAGWGVHGGREQAVLVRVKPNDERQTSKWGFLDWPVATCSCVMNVQYPGRSVRCQYHQWSVVTWLTTLLIMQMHTASRSAALVLLECQSDCYCIYMIGTIL